MGWKGTELFIGSSSHKPVSEVFNQPRVFELSGEEGFRSVVLVIVGFGSVALDHEVVSVGDRFVVGIVEVVNAKVRRDPYGDLGAGPGGEIASVDGGTDVENVVRVHGDSFHIVSLKTTLRST